MMKFGQIALRALVVGVFSLGIAACSGSSGTPQEPFADPAAAGRFIVGHTQDLVVDAARGGRELPIDIWYPVDDPGDAEPAVYVLQDPLGIESEVAFRDAPPGGPGERPLIVFSHGFGGINTQSVPLMEHLASHGFVVVAPSHTGNINGDMSSEDPAADRVPDVTEVIDFLRSRCTDENDRFHGKINTREAGVAGHSFGGFTATASVTGYDIHPADPRVVAVMPIAAANSRITDDELAGLDKPTLLLCGTLDGLMAQQERTFLLADAAPDLFRVDVIDANHTHFANICQIGQWLIDAGLGKDQWPALGAGALIGPWEATCEPPALDIEIALRIQNLYAAAFFHRYLQGDERYAPWLTEAWAEQNESQVVFYESR